MTDPGSSSPPPEPIEEDPLEGRLPCSDGNCVGVADADGHCTECGIFVGVPDAPVEEDDEDRSHCPDGTCIGVIGPDGRCTECGMGDDAELEDDEELENDEELEDDNEELEDDDDRIPCPDGSCIGIIGPDGSCTECGSKAEEPEA